MGDVSRLYRGLIRPILFTLPPELAHVTAIRLLRAAARGSLLWRKHFTVNHPSLGVRFGSGPDLLEFPNPVGLAAGFDKNGEALAGLAALGFGFIEAGTFTPRPQPGNPKPRLFRFKKQQALVNRLGFNNKGAARAVRNVSKVQLPIPLGFNLGKNKDTPLEKAAEDYTEALDLFYDWADFFVINVSSPNTPGLRQLQSAESLRPLLGAIRDRRNALVGERGGGRPRLFVKISPDELLGEEFVTIAMECGFDGVVATNTTLGREGLGGSPPADGGMSGRPLFAKSTEVLRRLYRAAKGRLIFIGVGGVFSAEDAYEKILAGASLVEVYTGFVYEGPALVKRINQGLVRLLARDGFKSIQEAVGKKA